MRQNGFTKFFIMALFLVAALAFSVAPSEAKRGKKHDRHSHSASVEDAENVVVSVSGYFVKTKSGELIEGTYRFPREIDLMDEDANLNDDIFDVPLAEGKYRWIRLKVNAHKDVIDSYVVIDGERHSLWIPSGKRKGLRLVRGFKVSESGEADISIDFDVEKSVREPRGDGGNYILKPTIKLSKRHNHDHSSVDANATDDEVVVVVPGSINGTVTASLVQTRTLSCGVPSEVYLFTGGSIAPDDVDANVPNPIARAIVVIDSVLRVHTYNFDSVDPGEYTVAFTCHATDDHPDTDDVIAFSAGGTVTVSPGVATVLNF